MCAKCAWSKIFAEFFIVLQRNLMKFGVNVAANSAHLTLNLCLRSSFSVGVVSV